MFHGDPGSYRRLSYSLLHTHPAVGSNERLTAYYIKPAVSITELGIRKAVIVYILSNTRISENCYLFMAQALVYRETNFQQSLLYSRLYAHRDNSTFKLQPTFP